MIISFIALSLSAGATTAGLEKAERKAREFLSTRNASVGELRNVDFLPASRSAGRNVYLFTRDSGGFVVVSTTHAGEQVLGYSDSGNLTSTTLPENFVGWLTDYEDQIAANPSAAVASETTAADDRPAIAPLLWTQWDQGDPYNQQCPELDGERCITGCVATAMAQIMAYHRYPVSGKGQVTYQWKDRTLSLDLDTVTFDWDNLLPRYEGTENSTPAQQKAVATLMKACGYSSRMNYGLYWSEAQYANAFKGYYENFGYSAGMEVIYRNYYTDTDWNGIIYDQLAKWLPVYYKGHGSAGHAFVCDGYDGDGYFHINWGWNGAWDGYFRLSALNPSGSGSGGSDGGYSYLQGALINIRPDNNIPYEVNMFGKLISNNGLYFDNPHPFTINATFGARYYDADGQHVISGSSFSVTGCNYSNAWINYEILKQLNLPDGEYRLYPVFRLYGEQEWRDFTLIPSCQRYMLLLVENGSVHFLDAANGEKPVVRVTELQSPPTITEMSPFTLNAECVNSSEILYSDHIYLHLSCNNGLDSIVDAGYLEVLPNSLRTINIRFNNGLPKGDYNYLFTDKDGTPISEELPLTVSGIDEYVNINGVWYAVTSEENHTVIAIKHPQYTYTGDVIVPYEIEIDGKCYTVSAVERDIVKDARDITALKIHPYWTENIEANEFADFPYLRELYLPEGVREIAHNAFGFCQRLTTVTLPESLETIGECAFEVCFELDSIHFGAGLRTIGPSAFHNSGKLRRLHFYAALEEIGRDAFCSLLEEIICDALVPPVLGVAEYPGPTFNAQCYGTCILRVPEAAELAYRQAPEWSLFKINGDAGMSAVTADTHRRHNVYNLKGILLKAGVSDEELRLLSPGQYIIDNIKVNKP